MKLWPRIKSTLRNLFRKPQIESHLDQELRAYVDMVTDEKISAGISAFFASLSPRTLAWSASLGAVALLLQAGVIGAVLVKNQPGSFQTASLSPAESHELGPNAPPHALVRFAPDARVTDITALLDNYQASIVDGAKGGLFRLQFGNKAMTKDEIAGLMNKLQTEKIVTLAVATP